MIVSTPLYRPSFSLMPASCCLTHHKLNAASISVFFALHACIYFFGFIHETPGPLTAETRTHTYTHAYIHLHNDSCNACNKASSLLHGIHTYMCMPTDASTYIYICVRTYRHDSTTANGLTAEEQHRIHDIRARELVIEARAPERRQRGRAFAANLTGNGQKNMHACMHMDKYNCIGGCSKYIYIYIHMYMYMYIYIYTCTHGKVDTCIPIHAHMHAYGSTMRTKTIAPKTKINIPMSTFTCIHTHIYTQFYEEYEDDKVNSAYIRTYTHIHTHTHSSMRHTRPQNHSTYIHTYTHTHTHTYTHTVLRDTRGRQGHSTYIHTYIHTHTHTHSSTRHTRSKKS
jgi:hypothetical protein